MNNDEAVQKGENLIKELVPGITTEREKATFAYLDSHKSQLKNEELFYRVQQK